MPRPVTLCGYLALCGVSIFCAQQNQSPTPSALNGPVPLHVPSTQALRENAAALATPQATTAVTSVVNAASFAPSNAPGSLSIVYGVDLALPQPTTIVTSVKANGFDAPILQSSPTQMTILIPWELAPGSVNLDVRRLGQSVATKTIDLSQYSPGIYTLNGAGHGRASAEDAAGIPLTDSHLAVPGTTVSIFANGLGPTVPQYPTGALPPSPFPTVVTPVVFIGGQQATGVLAQLTTTALGVYKVSFVVPAATGPGEQPVFLQIGGSASNIVTIPVRGALGPMPPEAGSVSPSSGSGSTQTFSALYSDPNGVQDLAWVQILLAVAADGGGQPFCFVHYDRPGNGLWLYGDGGFFLGPVTPGTVSATLRNNACAVNTSAASFTPIGTALTLNVPITFKPGFVGDKTVYLRAYDRTEQDTGMLARGTYNTSYPPPPGHSVIPASGSGSAQTFIATYPDAPGFTGVDLGWEQMLFAVATDGGGQPFCLAHYDRAGNGLWLYGDSGFFLGPVTPGTTSSLLKTSACEIDTAATTALSTGGVLQWSLPVTFTSSMLGARKTFLRASSPIGIDSGFNEIGTWTIDGTPSPMSITPSSGSAHTQTFTATFSDPDGAAQIAFTQILFAVDSTGGGQPFCFVEYNSATKSMYLLGSDGSVLGPVTPGSNAPPLVNTACALIPSSSAITASGNTLTMKTTIAFGSAIPSSVQTYLWATDTTALYSGWQLRGTFNPVP